jgi:hypothetical protein
MAGSSTFLIEMDPGLDLSPTYYLGLLGFFNKLLLINTVRAETVQKHDASINISDVAAGKY